MNFASAANVHDSLRRLARLFAEGLRRNAIGLLILGCSVGIVVATELVNRPRPLSLADAMTLVHSGSTRYVTLDGVPDGDIRLYAVFPSKDKYGLPTNDIVHTPEKLSRFSPVDGIPLNGPDAVPVSEWPSLIGARVRLSGSLTYTGIFFEKEIFEWLHRWYFATTVVGNQTLFALQHFHEIMPLTGNSLETLEEDRSYALSGISFEFKLWLDQDNWVGELRNEVPRDLEKSLKQTLPAEPAPRV